MNMIISHSKKYILYLFVLVLFACQQPGKNTTGSEYMPDMGHSIAYEANYYNYYYNNTWGSQEEYYAFVKPRLPVDGTVARGFAGGMDLERMEGRSSDNAISIPPNGSVPYYYGDSEEERLRATAEILANPFPITDEGLARAKDLYNIYCGICHGDKGDGLGYLAREDGGKYLAQPANLLLDEFVNSSNGRFYHSIMYGKNLMGSYKDKLSFEERWQVIHYIRSLQAKELKLEYNQYLNTLNNVDRPAGETGAELTMHDNTKHVDAEEVEGMHVTDNQDHE